MRNLHRMREELAFLRRVGGGVVCLVMWYWTAVPVVALPGGEATSPEAEAERDSDAAGQVQDSEEPPPWYERINLSGDFRSRYEGFYQSDRAARNRFRMRLRLRLDSQINGDTRVSLRIASGDSGTPVSTNQTFTEFFRSKPLNLDRAFLAYNPQAESAITLGAGKFGMPLTRTQMLFDDDLNVEGAWEAVSWNVTDTVGINLVGVQTAVNEVSRGADTYMLGGYAEVNVELGRTSFQVSAANYAWNNVDSIARASAVRSPITAILTNDVLRDEEGVVTGYASRFNVVDIISEVSFRVGGRNYPVRLLAEYSHNTRAANDRDSGFWTEAEFGSASDAGSFEASYTYGWIQQDVTPSAFIFSDVPGTNLRLHMINASWMLLPNLSWDVTVHVSKRLFAESRFQNQNWLVRPHIATVIKF